MAEKDPERELAEKLLAQRSDREGAGQRVSEAKTVATPESQFRDTSEATAEAAREAEPLIGTRIDVFEILSLLGEGGFGKVYKARDLKLRREVALKLLKPTGKAFHTTLFAREAQAIAALSKHPGIVEIHQWGEHGGQFYFVLEYVPRSASSLLREHPDGVPLAEALRIIAGCAEALSAAHAQGMLHRDIKPANILLEDDGRPKVADFGLAHLQKQEDDSDFTLAGAISGSPRYMSPEQATPGAKLDARSDVFSLGVTLYEMLSGHIPWEGRSASEIMNCIRLNQRVPLEQRRPDLEAGILKLVDKATAHRPGDRFQSAQEFARALHIALKTLERSGRVESPPTSVSPRSFSLGGSWRGVAIGLCIVLAAAAVLGPFLRDRSTEAQSALDERRYADAIAAFDRVLAADAADSDALLGKVFALLLSGAPRAEARELIETIPEGPLRAEAEAALTYEEKGVGARGQVEEVAKNGSAYAEVLLARIQLLEEQYADAVAGLEKLNLEQLRYAFQRIEARQTLAQARFRMGELDAARDIFDELARDESPAAQQLARLYLRRIEEERDRDRRSDALKLADDIRAMLDDGQAYTAETDGWTSRPLTFIMLPVEAGGSAFAFGSGCADLLPMILGSALMDAGPLTEVDRDLVNEMLAEQELAALVSGGPGRLALGRVMGGRLLIQCRFHEVGGTDRLSVRVTDVERTTTVPVDMLTLASQAPVDEVAQTLVPVLWNSIRGAYPLQGRLTPSGHAVEINIGTSVGVEPGLEFGIFADPSASAVSGATATVSTAGTERSTVTLTGLDSATLPSAEDERYYVRERES